MAFWSWLRSLFPSVTSYRFEREVRSNMREMARQTHPKEVVGLLRGRREGSKLVVDTIIFQPFKNTSHSATFHIDPSLTDIVGTFHSHPVPDATPSKADRRLFSEQGGIHVVMPLPYRSFYVFDSKARLLGVHSVRDDQEE